MAESPDVTAKAQALVEGAESPLDRVAKLYRFVQAGIGTDNERLEAAASGGAEPARNVAEVLKRGYGDERERTRNEEETFHEIGSGG